MSSEGLRVGLLPSEKILQPSTVCVTGATGFVAGPIVQRLLASGHTVHATCRNPDNLSSIKHLKALPGADTRLKFFKANLLEEGSFVDAVCGCTYVMHTASPYIVYVPNGKEEELLIKPALAGTENLLNAVNATESVKRVILTSSVAAISGDPHERGKGHVFTENDWTLTATPTVLPYFYSKKVAEEKAHEMCKAQKRWDLVTINPAQVFGPPLSSRADGESVQLMKGLVNGLMWVGCPKMGMGVVDVRDVAAAHCLAMADANASGRYILVSGSYTIKQMGNLLRPLYPSAYLPIANVSTWLMRIIGPLVGFPSDMISHFYGKTPLFNNSRIQELGLKFIPHIDSMDDMIQSMAAFGMVSKSLLKKEK